MIFPWLIFYKRKTLGEKDMNLAMTTYLFEKGLMEYCNHCNGYGSSLKEETDRCTKCNGTGTQLKMEIPDEKKRYVIQRNDGIHLIGFPIYNLHEEHTGWKTRDGKHHVFYIDDKWFDIDELFNSMQ